MKRVHFEVLANILFWILTVWLIASSFSIAFVDIEVINGNEVVNIQRDAAIIIQLLTLSAYSFIMFYMNYFSILKLRKEQNLLRTALLSASYFILAVTVYHLTELLPMYSEFPRLQFNLSTGITAFYFAVSTAYGLIKLWIFTENNRKQLLLEKKQTELTLLRSQLRPHFLFNTLNNLLAMVDQKNNPNLADSLNTLSNLLRYVVYDTSEGKVSINKEISFVKNFSKLQMLRFEKDEIEYNFDVEGEYDQQPVEPGIFIPFVENAFKYGVEIENKSFINIRFDLSDKNIIRFTITNSLHNNSGEKGGSGSGIKKAKERLSLVYPQKHKIEIQNDKIFQVLIEIESNERNNN